MQNLKKQSNYKLCKQYRIPTYDYSWDGYYFVTICTKDRKFLFGKIMDAKIKLSIIGEIAKKCWLEIPKHFGNMDLDTWVIMPNHIHGIITIGCRDSKIDKKEIEKSMRETEIEFNDYINHQKNVYSRRGKNRIPTCQTDRHPAPTEKRAHPISARTNLGSTFGHIKPQSLPIIIANFKAAVTRTCKLIGKNGFAWQPRYYDHIIRNEKDLYNIREYIKSNPLNWELDRSYPENMDRIILP